MEILLVYSVEAYARKWVKAVRLLIQIRIRKLKWSKSTKSTSVFKYPDAVEHLLVKTHVDVLRMELVLDSSQCNPTDTATTLSKEEIIDKHKPVLLYSNETINR